MPWKEKSVMSLRKEFVQFAKRQSVSFSELCNRYGITRATGYKWVERYEEEGDAGLQNRSRAPKVHPNKTSEKMESLVIDCRKENPEWGGRKLYKALLKEGETNLPHPNTITDILKRHKLINEESASSHRPFIRFEHENPNDLWQMDFKGHFKMEYGRCHPLTVLDDCSRYSLGIQACSKENEKNTREKLIPIFERYGLPKAINMDNGSPWGACTGKYYTSFAIWLIRLGIQISFSRPLHPQTNGKLERFHRTLKGELLNHKMFSNLEDAQVHLEQWRHKYNNKRPHQALNDEVPAERYKQSHRNYPQILPDIEYAPDDKVIRVTGAGVGFIKYNGARYRVGGGFYGQHVAVRPTTENDLYDIFFCAQKIKTIDLNLPDG